MWCYHVTRESLWFLSSNLVVSPFFLLPGRSCTFGSFIAVSGIVAAEHICSETLLFKYYVFRTVEFCYFHCGFFLSCYQIILIKCPIQIIPECGTCSTTDLRFCVSLYASNMCCVCVCIWLRALPLLKLFIE